MKNNISASHLSMAFTLLLVLLSFGFGYHSYSQAEQMIVSDLNKALQKTVQQNRSLWLDTDTIQAYSKLQRVMGDSVLVSSHNRYFSEALSIPVLREASGLSLHILKKDSRSTVMKEIPSGYLVSDTLVWLSTSADASGVALSFRGYARCPATVIFGLSQQKASGFLLLLAVLWSGCSFVYLRRKKQVQCDERLEEEDKVIVFGNLSLVLREACFYNTNGERLRLTPMQYALMEMFYLSASHSLSKPHICRSLWPGKDNAEETLYTLIRRLKPVIEQCSNLRITTDRGRAYTLELG